MKVQKFGQRVSWTNEEHALAESEAKLDEALFALVEPPQEPFSCTGTGHTHRWLRFGRNGEKQTVVIDVNAAGLVVCSEQAIVELLREAGFEHHDPDRVEESASARLSWARSRVQDQLNAALNWRGR